jgi:hypothetical protein
MNFSKSYKLKIKVFDIKPLPLPAETLGERVHFYIDKIS